MCKQKGSQDPAAFFECMLNEILILSKEMITILSIRQNYMFIITRILNKLSLQKGVRIGSDQYC